MPIRPKVALIAAAFLMLALEGSSQTLLPGDFVARYVWRSPNPAYGGFSGLELSDDGARFSAISDRGVWFTGLIKRNAKGHITALLPTQSAPLLDQDSAALKGHQADSEGLAIAQDGRVFISFEGKRAARVNEYQHFGAKAKTLAQPERFKSLPRNSALEALAIDAKGTLYTLPEDPQPNGFFPVYRYRNGQWDDRLRIPGQADFLAVGADFGPDGRFYLLERGFHGAMGFSSRVRSFALTARGFTNGRVEMQSHRAQYDNLEGLAVWRDAGGAMRLTMISDDNFFWLQRSEIVEYRVPRRSP